ncbi:junctional adhesion molecule A [Protopterus annectens]|uniref:junctional adhesion molecule A n=1 Tax=Protopterus annectens TaxID=7888 RepID=UPI001CF95F08|nr:junctional adhesion molecule A [Protopterus annectens]
MELKYCGLFGFILLTSLALDGIPAFSVTTSNPKPTVKENQTVDLYCEYSADFQNPRVEWKFKSPSGSTTFVFYNAELIVPPTSPQCRIPATVTTGTAVTLKCQDSACSPACTYRWFKDKMLMPIDPKGSSAFANSSYSINPNSGDLVFSSVSKADAGTFSCEAANNIGSPLTCTAAQMLVEDKNVGGIVAAVVIVLLILALLGVGLWFAYRRGYFQTKTQSKPNVIYQPAERATNEDFKQTSSFVV